MPTPIPRDRARQAYSEFRPLDGTFADNVLVQAKNGAIDFQPREPFHPLFGGLPKTQLMLELQISKEYLGQATSFAYLGPLFAEVLGGDTDARGKGTTVAKIIDGSAFGSKLNRHGGRGQYRPKPRLDGLHHEPGQLVCLRAAGMGSGAEPRGHCPRMGGADVFARSGAGRSAGQDDDGLAGGPWSIIPARSGSRI